MATSEQKNLSDFGQQAVALAEQLGRIAGTIEGTAESWLKRQSLADQLARIRDSAAEMLDSLTTGAARGRKAATESAQALTEQARQRASSAASTATSMASAAVESARRARTSAKGTSKKKGNRAMTRKAVASRVAADPAHAPGKRHRKPPKKGPRGRKSDVRIANMKVAEANRRRRPSHV
jgi:hypothetical protein